MNDTQHTDSGRDRRVQSSRSTIALFGAELDFHNEQLKEENIRIQ